MSTYLSELLRQRLADADDSRCAYCQTAVENTGQPLTIDHIIPQAQGGHTAFDNLCLACRGAMSTKARRSSLSTH
jgi:5-methylcytosine-specific restriction endonuclease McrA